ncbi:endoglucanase [Ardenticatena maritima]|uniref:Endoglucanase n=1 Tax=Ardenticatena maritima TaxID=872965 RepID=A0A0M8K6K5_9CHLR|nr:M42 family metallopeptidase [Ardenticatena maritima]KPL86378.1 endoglucanase [Ardenticatena maritima]GAP62825.1 endoglucanase [Ardenticatena maritima]
MDVKLNEEFLKRLLEAIGPSGFEDDAAQVWMEAAQTFADRVERDTHGNTYATINPGGSPRLLLAGHLDEIGLIVNYIDEKGYVYVKGLGGWDPQVLIGQRVRFKGLQGDVIGVVGRKAIHLLKSEERKKAVELKDLWIDIGAKDGDEAKQYLEVGTIGVIEQPVVQVLNGRVVSRALDNRIGAFTVLEALRHMKANGVTAEVTAVATVQEEIGLKGAFTSAYRLNPDTALVVDVTHCTDQPGISKKESGESPLGSGANLTVGPQIHPKVLRRLRDLAEEHAVPYTLTASTRYTGTDTDAIFITREGIPAALLSIPNRYMHSPSEMVDLHDVEAVVKLMTLYALNPVTDLVR